MPETQGNKRPWTPGPWEFLTAQKGWPYEPTKDDLLRYVSDCWDDSEGAGWGICRSDAVGRVVCIFGNGKATEANALLIAAAPALFEALQSLVDEMPICCCHESWTKRGRVDPQCVRCSFKEVIADAESALAKAIGGQP